MVAVAKMETIGAAIAAAFAVWLMIEAIRIWIVLYSNYDGSSTVQRKVWVPWSESNRTSRERARNTRRKQSKRGTEKASSVAHAGLSPTENQAPMDAAKERIQAPVPQVAMYRDNIETENE